MIKHGYHCYCAALFYPHHDNQTHEHHSSVRHLFSVCCVDCCSRLFSIENLYRWQLPFDVLDEEPTLIYPRCSMFWSLVTFLSFTSNVIHCAFFLWIYHYLFLVLFSHIPVYLWPTPAYWFNDFCSLFLSLQGSWGYVLKKISTWQACISWSS